MEVARSTQTSAATSSMAYVAGLNSDEFPRADLPEIKNKCPLCAGMIDVGLEKCPRCGVALKGAKGTDRPRVDAPSPASTSPPAEPVTEPSLAQSPAHGKHSSDLAPARPAASDVSSGMITAAPAATKVGGKGPVNGRGVTNGTGLVNGAGAVNGAGLVNGTGMVNGIRRDDRVVLVYREKSPMYRRWQFLAVLIAIAVILPAFIYISYVGKSSLSADGDFGEWSEVVKFGMVAPAALPEVSVDEWAIQSEANDLHLYIKTGSNIMGTTYVDSFFLFVDSDGNPATGYSVSTIGADYMFELHGWDQKVQSAALMRFDSTSDRFNWTSWTSMSPLAVATKALRLEASGELPSPLTADARFMLLAQDNMPSRVSSVSYPVPAEGGALIVVQEPGARVDPYTGSIPLGINVSLARLTLRCEGISGTVFGISPVIVGGGLASPISEVSLSPGMSETVDVFVSSSSTTSGTLMSAYVTETGISSTFADVIIVGEPVRAYVFLPPSTVQIDGAFGDWMGRVSPDNDSDSVVNPNVDVAAVGSVNTTSYAAFYVGVKGEIFEGAYVPAVRGKPTSQGGGGGAVIPQRKTGEDLLRVYIDSDILTTTGMAIQRSSKTIGADYMLEINGINGRIASRSLKACGPDGWTTVSDDFAAMTDSQRIEMSVPSASIGDSSSFVAIIETTDWRARSDWAWTGSVPDPWVVDASGNTYQSADGAIWSYLDTPTLAPGDYVIDVMLTTDETKVFIVTNTGRTYVWDIGTSTSWTAGETIPISIAVYSEAVSMSFFSKTGAWLLTRNGSYFYLMNAGTSQKPWTLQGTVASGITDFTELVYSFAGTSMYALQSGPNTRLHFSSNGNSFSSVTSPTGSTSNQTDFTYIGSKTNTSDRIFVLCEDGKMRYSPNGGQTWSAHGNLPTPTGGNTTKYVGIGIDPSGYMWVVTDTGYCFRSTDTSTYNTFVCVGQTPISGIVAIAPMTAVPEFSTMVLPVLAIAIVVALIRIERRRLQ